MEEYIEYCVTKDILRDIIETSQKHPYSELYMEDNGDEDGGFLSVILDDDPDDSMAFQKIWELEKI